MTITYDLELLKIVLMTVSAGATAFGLVYTIRNFNINKAKRVGAAVAAGTYVVSPIDLVSELYFFVLGYGDDVVVVVVAVVYAAVNRASSRRRA